MNRLSLSLVLSLFGSHHKSHRSVILLPTLVSALCCYPTTAFVHPHRHHPILRHSLLFGTLTSLSSPSSSAAAAVFRGRAANQYPFSSKTFLPTSKLYSTSNNDNNSNDNEKNLKMSAAIEEPADAKKQKTTTTSLDATGFKSFTPDDMTVGARYGLCISSVIPRPVAVITSKSSDGVLNCAPFSYTSISTHDPPIVTHGLCLSRGNKKDTLQNIEATNEWVYNVLTTNYLDDANECATTQKIDEAAAFGLETIDSEIIKVPRLKAAAVSMECKLWDKKEVYNDKGEHTTTIVMGRVVKFHVHESVLKEGREEDAPLVDIRKVQAVGRAGDITYWPAGVVEESVKPMPRPK